MKKKMVALTLFCLFIAGFTKAQFLNQSQFTSHLDSFVQKLMERIPVIPAISITIVKGDDHIFNRAYGWANKEAGIKADVNTAFYIASSTKSFTALAAALLDYEKKVMLDSPLKKYLGNIRFSADISDSVTVRSLLMHTSGLENGPLTFRMAYSGMSDRKVMLKILGDATTVRAKPGIYKYDNLGYNIYALAIQEYLNTKWQDLLQEKIFSPLGMNHTTAYISAAKKKGWVLAEPYSGYGPNGLERIYLRKDDNTMQSAGGLITTPSDIALWLQAQITKGKINNKRVFPEMVMKEVHSGFAPYEKGSSLFAAPGEYGLGWSVSKYNGEKIIYHFGGFPGFRAHISFMPDKKTGLAIFVNEGTIGSAALEMLAGIVYDWVTGLNVIEKYRQKIDTLELNHKKAMEGTQRSFEERAKRTWQLSLPLQTYTGQYQHPFFGSMEVSSENNVLVVKMGQLHAVSTPYTQKETIRVELIPGTGQVVYFNVDETGKVNSLKYDGQEYKRIL